MQMSHVLGVRIIPALRLAGLALAILMLQGCSAIKLAYNNLPEFGYWWADAYADFNESQSLAVRAELNRLLAWHRSDELPKLADLLQRVQRITPNDTTAATVCGIAADTRLRIDAISSQSEKAVISLVQSLAPQQLTNIEKRFAKTNAEWRAEWLQLSPKERSDKRVKTTVERSEEFYGKLDDRQVALVRALLDSSIYDPQGGYTERLRRQQDFVQTLRTVSTPPRPNTADATVAMRGYLERSISSPNLAYRAYADRLLQESCTLFAQLHNSTSAEQRTRAVRRLAAYERDLRELNSQR